MENPNNPEKNIVKYPKKNSFVFLGNKKNNPRKPSKIFDRNPKVNYFNLSSHFIYAQGDFFDYYDSLAQKNNIKLNFEELNVLKKTI